MVDVSLDESAYQADFKLTELYQAFSAELVRLALLGIAGYGFLISNLALKDGVRTEFFGGLQKCAPILGAGVVCLGFSTAAALAHRFFSTDCMTHQVTILRLLKRLESPNWTEEERASDAKRLLAERAGQYKDLKRCRWLLTASALLLFFGAFAVAFTFAATLFVPALHS
jgi:hypothetical protein